MIDRLRSTAGRAQARLEGVVASFTAIPAVRAALVVNDGYNAAGGGLLAAGLAFSALFAVIPGLLLVASVLVVVIDDPAMRLQVVTWLIDRVPPLRDVAATVVATIASDARVGSVIGVVLFLWGASGFYVALDGAIDRTIPGGRPGDPIISRIRGLLAVALLVGTTLVAFVAGTLASLFSLGPLMPIASPAIAVAVATALCLAVYLLLPNDRPDLRAALPAALGAGTSIGLLTSFFGILAPWLVQGFLALGVIASVFVALVWFHWTFQILLFGASYARIRRDRSRAKADVDGLAASVASRPASQRPAAG